MGPFGGLPRVLLLPYSRDDMGNIQRCASWLLMPMCRHNVIRIPARWQLRRPRRGQASDGHHAEVCPEACSTRACGGEMSVVGKLVVHSGGSVAFARRAASSSSSQFSFRLRGPRFKGTESDQDPDSCPQWSVLLPTLTLNPRLPNRTPPHGLTDQKGIAILLPWMILGFFL